MLDDVVSTNETFYAFFLVSTEFITFIWVIITCNSLVNYNKCWSEFNRQLFSKSCFVSRCCA